MGAGKRQVRASIIGTASIPCQHWPESSVGCSPYPATVPLGSVLCCSAHALSHKLANRGVLAVQAGERAERPGRVPGRPPAPHRSLTEPLGCVIQGRLSLPRSQQQMAGTSGGVLQAWRLKARTLMMFAGSDSQLSHRQWTPTAAAWACAGKRLTSSPASATHRHR